MLVRAIRAILNAHQTPPVLNVNIFGEARSGLVFANVHTTANARKSNISKENKITS